MTGKGNVMCIAGKNHSLEVTVSMPREVVMRTIMDSLDKMPRWRLLFITPVRWKGGLRGTVREDHIELHRYSGMFESPFKPYLIGTLTDQGGSLQVTARCGLSRLGWRILQCWAVLCLILGGLLIVLQLIGSPAVTTSPIWQTLLAIIGFWAFGLAWAAMARAVRWNDCRWLTDHLAAVLTDAEQRQTAESLGER